MDGLLRVVIAGVVAAALVEAAGAAEFKILQPMGDKPVQLKNNAGYYVPTTPETARWGSLPNLDAKPVLSVPSGSVVTFDSVSHEGVLEDQGKDPVKFFGQYGIKPEQVLKDAQAIAASSLEHDFVKDGPHVITGPVEIQGAKAGDVLKVEMLAMKPRVPYGVISNRHGKGALPGEFPETKPPEPDASAAQPEKYHNVFRFAPIREVGGKWYGLVTDTNGRETMFPLRPFVSVTRPYHLPPTSRIGAKRKSVLILLRLRGARVRLGRFGFRKLAGQRALAMTVAEMTP